MLLFRRLPFLFSLKKLFYLCDKVFSSNEHDGCPLKYPRKNAAASFSCRIFKTKWLLMAFNNGCNISLKDEYGMYYLVYLSDKLRIKWAEFSMIEFNRPYAML